MDSSNDTSDQVASKPTPEEVDTPKEDNTISDPLSMGNSKDDSAQSTPKPCSETEVNTETNAVGAVDDATCKHPRDDEQCSPASKRSKSSDEESESESSDDDVVTSSTRSRIVVFDIDGTLCIGSYVEEKEEEIIKKWLPECPIIVWNEAEEYYGTTRTVRHPHIFLPHLKILFDYLLEQDVRIVFFSANHRETRNLIVIPELLTSFWGSEKFEALKAKGQFDIFSLKHCRKRAVRGEGTYVKDLKVVLRDGETLLDVILVDDDYSFAAHDQKPFLSIIDLGLWQIKDKDEVEKNRGKCGIWRGKSSNFCLNSVYYMLGVFNTYFGNEKYKALPLREGLNQLIPEESFKCPLDFFAKHSFADDMINLGLTEVRKLVPNAVYY
ncbi:uncharacterized protein LOC135844387 isoform X2 [Planococcus citri]|uniref:uncharacterized protein LOC135844387 isoform X2 n=1 Tax=Planococcus citri TaxID=170843 RepID=UPI0031F9CC21